MLLEVVTSGPFEIIHLLKLIVLLGTATLPAGKLEVGLIHRRRKDSCWSCDRPEISTICGSDGFD